MEFIVSSDQNHFLIIRISLNYVIYKRTNILGLSMKENSEFKISQLFHLH